LTAIGAGPMYTFEMFVIVVGVSVEWNTFCWMELKTKFVIIVRLPELVYVWGSISNELPRSELIAFSVWDWELIITCPPVVERIRPLLDEVSVVALIMWTTALVALRLELNVALLVTIKGPLMTELVALILELKVALSETSNEPPRVELVTLIELKVALLVTVREPLNKELPLNVAGPLTVKVVVLRFEKLNGAVIVKELTLILLAEILVAVIWPVNCESELTASPPIVVALSEVGPWNVAGPLTTSVVVLRLEKLIGAVTVNDVAVTLLAEILVAVIWLVKVAPSLVFIEFNVVFDTTFNAPNFESPSTSNE
jgi:hypothetical protein